MKYQKSIKIWESLFEEDEGHLKYAKMKENTEKNLEN